MSYQVLARKWRPRSLQTLVGQSHVKLTLINALNTQRLHHAYLLTGTHGVGKTSIARIIAKNLNCERGVSAEACGTCTSCVEIDEGRFMDLIEIDAASRTKVEDTRELLENVQYLPTRGRFKVYLIDEVHMLSDHSFNALLKTLEEPPPHVKFLLATTDPDRLPVTVLSRCLQFHLKNLLPEEIEAHLIFILGQENIPHEKAALTLIARAAEGSMRDALSILDQAISYCQGNVTLTETQTLLGTLSPEPLWVLFEALADKQADHLLAGIQQLAVQAVDFSAALKEVLSLLHQVALAQVVPSSSEESSVHTFAKKFSPEEVQLYYQIALMGQRDLNFAPSPKQGFEMIWLRMLAFQPVKMEIPKSPLPPLFQRGEPIDTTTTPVSSIVKKESVKGSSLVVPPFEKGEPGGISSLDFYTFFPQLNLAGLSHTLASHCTLKEFTDTQAHLLLDPKHATLLNPKLEERISLAFSQYFSRTIKVSVAVGSENMDTPARRLAQTQSQQHQAAVETLHQTPAVQSLMKHFDAQLIPESVEIKE